ncbi:MAG: FtsQ-type POTRA domain-containing protein [Solirubrobacterales bacterium]|nr:FtsQ-type POTRA domain-containing protein [Solirubrobacterales bacterium]
MIAQELRGRLRRPVASAPQAEPRARGRFRLPRPRPRLLLALVAALVILAGAWLWFRDSSLVGVKRVTVSGLSGPDAGRIRDALTTAARNMTTLHVHMDQLHTAVTPYPAVKRLQVSTHFPHGMTIRVVEQVPVAALTFDGRRVAVASDGTLLHDLVTVASLPVIPVSALPGGSQVSDPNALDAVRLLASAPYPMLARVSLVSTAAAHGLVAQLRAGPSIFFGDTRDLVLKWTAAAAVLADPGSAGAAYIDVTDPRRPAAGAGSAAPGAGSPASAQTPAAASSGASGASGSTTAPTGG